MEPWQFILIGVAVVSLGYSIYQGTRCRRKLPRQDALRDTLDDGRTVESSARGFVQNLEVRAYDYSREVEARIDNRLSVLDQLIVDADREIERLQALLAESRLSNSEPERDLSLSDQQRCFALQEAGFQVDEIARCLQTTPAGVERVLNEWQRPDRRAA